MAFVGSALGDWDESMPAKWVQYPDLSPMGIDVSCTIWQNEFILADDFLCQETGPITDIHIWGSWLGDYIPFQEDPHAVRFVLSIHADIPVGPDIEYSRPGEVLWWRIFDPGDFIARPWAEDIEEGWMNPPEEYIFPADWTCWQYNFRIPVEEAFVQQGTPDEPVVYWLDVQALPMDDAAQFGWKTSIDHWNDKAVWGVGLEPYPGPWWELFYPPGHEMQGQPIDLAFVIGGEGGPPPELDFGDAPQSYPVLLANNGANHVLGIGPYFGFAGGPAPDGEPDGLPTPDATGDDANNIDDEDGVSFGPPVAPGGSTTVTVSVVGNGFVNGWVDFDGDGTWYQADEHVVINQAVSSGTHTFNYTVPTTAVPGVTFARLRISANGGEMSDGPSPDGEVEDYRLRILEEPEPYKWIQNPDLSPEGFDVNATRYWPYLLADDFLCTQPGPITEIFVWASWLNDYLPFQDQPDAVRFTLSIHADIPAEESPTGYSMPGELLWLGEFEPGMFETFPFAEGIEEGWLNPPEEYFFPADWTCWLYHFQIDEDMAFLQRGSLENPKVYWLDVQATPLDPDSWFGWKTSIDHWNDNAVWIDAVEPFMGDWYELWYPPQHPLYPRAIDLAFALIGPDWTPVPDTTVPRNFGLRQNTPNPFNPKTEISYDVPADGGRVTIEIFDIAGNRVRTLLDEFRGAGSHSVFWDGMDDQGQALASGVYFYRLEAPNVQATKKMMLLR